MGAGSEDGDTSPKAASSSSKTKRNTKKTLKSKSSDENEPKENSPKKSISIKLKKIDDQVDNDKEHDGKIPLLDQNPVVEGSRNRKTINKLVIKEVPVSKRSRAVEIPNGRGKALGRITNVCNRLKGLDDLMIKTLHKGLFGKAMGKTNDLLNNIMLFRGFEFKKDSDTYDEKLIDLSKKFTVQEMKSLIYTFDLEMNYKTKEEAVTCILDFLIEPQPSKNPKPALEGHPRRKATKRDYFEADIADEYSKRRKKKKKKTTDESEEDDSPKKKAKKLKSNDVETDGEKDESETGDNESENEKDSESKKPAKKRKSNQIIDQKDEEEEGEEELLRNGGSPVSKTKKKERK